MATALGGLSSPSACVASANRMLNGVIAKAQQLSLSTANGSNFSSRLAVSRKSPTRVAAAAAEPLQAVEPAPEPVEAQIASVVAGEKPKGEDVFAVIMVGSHQYIVAPGRYINTQRLKGANVDDKIILNKVLLVGTKTNVYIGEPVVQNAVVHAVVEEQGLDPKVIIFKYKKKKHYRRTVGHRQPNTRIRITGITGYQDAPSEPIPQ
ncbi:ribosomal protein L21 [Wolffia australiana]